MPISLVIGLLTVLPTLAAGGALIAYGARRRWDREAPHRRRTASVEQLLQAVGRALDPEPRTSLDGLRSLSSLRDTGVVEPEDDDFIEDIARVVLATRLEDVPDDVPLVVGTDAGVSDIPAARVVLPHELLAALLAVDIATAHGRPPSPLAWRVANASSGGPADAAPLPVEIPTREAPPVEAPPLRRTA